MFNINFTRFNQVFTFRVTLGNLDGFDAKFKTIFLYNGSKFLIPYKSYERLLKIAENLNTELLEYRILYYGSLKALPISDFEGSFYFIQKNI